MKRLRILTFRRLRKKLAAQLMWISRLAVTSQLSGVKFRVAWAMLRRTLRLISQFRPAMASTLVVGAPMVTMIESADAQAAFEQRNGADNPFDAWCQIFSIHHHRL